MVNPRTKGQRGEREAGEWLARAFRLADVPQRNLAQTREGGADHMDFKPFCIEVKRQETLNLRAWWKQVSKAAQSGECPVVMFRQNRKAWEFLIPASTIGVELGYVRLEEREFILWGMSVLAQIQSGD